jgi:hypothetical protein
VLLASATENVAVQDVGFVPAVTGTPAEVDGKLPWKFGTVWALLPEPATRRSVVRPPPAIAWPVVQVAVT